MQTLTQRLVKRYAELVEEHGEEQARQYIQQCCWKIINDPDQPDSVRQGVKDILDSFDKYESQQLN